MKNGLTFFVNALIGQCFKTDLEFTLCIGYRFAIGNFHFFISSIATTFIITPFPPDGIAHFTYHPVFYLGAINIISCISLCASGNLNTVIHPVCTFWFLDLRKKFRAFVFFHTQTVRCFSCRIIETELPVHYSFRQTEGSFVTAKFIGRQGQLSRFLSVGIFQQELCFKAREDRSL